MKAIMNKQTKIIALCGKGGVGKTSISALITKMLTEDKTKTVLAIDADPAVGLSYPLGITVTKTVDTIRNDMITRIQNGSYAGKEALLRQLDYELFDALEEKDNLAFLAVGRPEGEGCFCQVNSLLKEIIKGVASKFDYVVIDGEAGIEQINRRVMEMVTHLLLISDASMKGRHVAATIDRVARKHTGVKKSGLFFNRMHCQAEVDGIISTTELNVLGWMAENDIIRKYDRLGDSFFNLDDDTFYQPLKEAVHLFMDEPV